MCETTMNNNGQRFSTTAGSDGKPSPPRTGFDPTPSSSFPVDPDFCVTTPFQLLTLALLIAKVTFESYTKNLKTLHLQSDINHDKKKLNFK
jgi:hypothetical protein